MLKGKLKARRVLEYCKNIGLYLMIKKSVKNRKIN
tara:strand:+ start:5126 stop:5230 length:105 start_codon:yes stop_codon:yes gene_type:complete